MHATMYIYLPAACHKTTGRCTGKQHVAGKWMMGLHITNPKLILDIGMTVYIHSEKVRTRSKGHQSFECIPQLKFALGKVFGLG